MATTEWPRAASPAMQDLIENLQCAIRLAEWVHVGMPACDEHGVPVAPTAGEQTIEGL